MSQLDRIEQLLQALCRHLGVRELEQALPAAADAAVAGAGQRYTGVVSRFEHGWGFIECEAMNRNYFVHYSDIEGTGMRSLDPGDVVSFEIAPGRDGRPKAVNVKRHQAGRAPARTPRIDAVPAPRSGGAYPNGDRGIRDEAEDEEGEEIPAGSQPAAVRAHGVSQDVREAPVKPL